MFRISFNALNNVVTGVFDSLQRMKIDVASRSMAHLKETDEEFDARYKAYFNQPDKDTVDGQFVKLSMI